MSLDDAVVDNLVYPDADPQVSTMYRLKKGEIGLLKCFIHYVYYRDETNNPIGDDWTKITMADFDQFRANLKYTSRFSSLSSIKPKVVASTPALPSSSNTSHLPTPVDLFKRGIKRDPSVFPTLKDEKFNDQWHRSFANQARAQDLSNVLDSTFVASTASDIALFDEKQKYLYAVLEAKVETAKGKSIIRKYESTYDAQKAYAEIHAHHLKSTKASLSSTKILEYITSAKIGDGSWHGTAETIILNWQEQVRLYERLIPTKDHLSDGQKSVLLQTAVHPLQELRQVKASAELPKAHHVKDIDYEGYVSLLLSAASDYDSKHVINKAKRQVYQHDVIEYEEETYNDADTFDIDTPVETIQAFVSNFRSKPNANGMPDRVRMPKDKWFSLDQKTKDLWDQIDDRQKSIILGYMQPPSPSSLFNKGTKKPPNHSKFPPPRRNVNLHEVSAYDFLQANIHDLHTMDDIDEVQENNESTDAPDPEPPDTLLINAAKGSSSNQLPPGDIRRVLSKSSKRMVNMTNIEYRVSYHKSPSGKSLSLVDRGANGGVAGTDVRVIFKTGRMVDIRGIDNHHCTNIDIGTVGGVVKTQKGFVLAIMHQYALLNKGSSIHSPCQLEYFKSDVNDKSIHVPGGLQRIQTLDGYIIPLSIKDGLARLNIRPYTDHEWDTLPHVILTSEMEWDPSVLDHDFNDDAQWGDVPDIDTPFDNFGDYKHRVIVQHLSYFQRHDGDLIDDIIDQCVFDAQTSFHPVSSVTEAITFYDAHETELAIPPDKELPLVPPVFIPKVTTKRPPDYIKLRPFFGWLSEDLIQKTFEHTTQ
jgi:hypothetical protein